MTSTSLSSTMSCVIGRMVTIQINKYLPRSNECYADEVVGMVGDVVSLPDGSYQLHMVNTTHRPHFGRNTEMTPYVHHLRPDAEMPHLPETGPVLIIEPLHSV